MRFSATLYRASLIILLATLCGCSTYRQIGSARLFSRETVIAFYALAPGEQSPGPLYQRVMTFAPTALFVADPAGTQGVWSVLTPSADYPAAVPAPESFSALDVGVVHVSRIAGVRRFLSDPEQQRADLAAAALSTNPWKILLLSEPLLTGRVDDQFDEIARHLEQHGALLALSPGEGYLRSRPVGAVAATAVRYITLPTDPAAPQIEVPWLTRAPQGGRYAILRAAPSRLSWSLYDGDGKLLDLLVVRPDKRGAGASDFLLTSEVTALMKYGTGEEPQQP